MILSFALIIQGCLFSAVHTFSTEQILLGNISEAYDSDGGPTQKSIDQTIESDNPQAVNLNVGCRVGQVKCYNSEVCIPVTRVCDEIQDCTDNSDEIDCYRKRTRTRSRPLFLTCKSGYTRCYDKSRCIPLLWVCDGGIPDCADKSDEIDCYRRLSTTMTSIATTSPILTCGSDDTRCYDNSRCIPLSWICDGYPDCSDGSDERDCYRRSNATTTSTRETTTQIVTCGSAETRCYDNSRCIPLRWICDGYPDCSDGSDERDCLTCDSGDTRCFDNSKCIPIEFICDGGSPDCSDGSDEIDCYRRSTTTRARTTTTRARRNTTTTRTTTTTARRTTTRARRNTTTTTRRTTTTARTTTTRARRNTTTARTTTTTILECSFGYTRCYDNSRCIPIRWICDGYPDCSDGSDERDCYRRLSTASTGSTATTPFNRPLSCSPGFTRCYDNYNCVPISWICDNLRDCRDNSDEIDCYRRSNATTTSTRETTTQIVTCSTTETRCYDNSRCVPLRWICDGDRDCVDNSDEIDCYRRSNATTTTTRETTTQIVTCGSTETRCYDNSRCVPLTWICDGDRDCVDNSDEIDCYRRLTTTAATTNTAQTGCSAGQVKCSNSTQCIPAYWVCDGIRDCSDNSDEISCSRLRDNNLADDRQPLTTPESQPNRTDHTLGKNDHKPTAVPDHHTSEYPREQLTTQESQTRPQAEATDHP